MGEFLAPWIQKFDADCLVFGGNITRAYHLFGPAFSAVLKSRNINTNVELSEQMETSAMIGGARLMNEDFWKQIKPLIPLM